MGRSVVSFTIKNIDVDRKMREKLKREIAPLLSKNRRLATDANANKPVNQPLSNESAEPSGGMVPTDNLLSQGVTAANNAPSQAMNLHTAERERPTGREIGDMPGAFSASRENKRLNMLGFGSNNMLDNGRDATNA